MAVAVDERHHERVTRRRVGYCDSSATLLYLPDRRASTPTDEDCELLAAHHVAVARGDDWHNPIAWLDSHGRGCTLHLVRTEPNSPTVYVRGDISWDDQHRVEAVLWLAETLALRSRNRWYAICAYDGFSAECRPTREHQTFEEFRRALPELIVEQNSPGPGPHQGVWPDSDDRCVVHKVWGPTWTP